MQLEIQLNRTASAARSFPIAGSAILTAETIKVPTKPTTAVVIKVILLFDVVLVLVSIIGSSG
jgi:hypothetical protein